MPDTKGAVELPPPPLLAKGYVTKQGSWWGTDDYEETPELRWPYSVQVFDRMRRTDSQIGSVLRAVMLPNQRAHRWIKPNGARDEVVEHISHDLGIPIMGQDQPTEEQQAAQDRMRRRRGRFSWGDHMRLALLDLVFGHMFFEQEAVISDDGLAHLAKLSPRMPRTITKVNVAEDGGLISIEQAGAKDPIPVNRLVAYVNEREGGNWFGTSLLRPAYKNWVIKDRLLRADAQTIERNGMGIPVYEGAPGEQSLAEGKAIAQSYRSGDNAGAAIPNGARLTLTGVNGALPQALPSIRYHDEQMARAVLAHFLNLGTQTGSWALGSTFADFFFGSLNASADHIDEVTTQHVIEDIVDWNWGPDEPAPVLIHDEIGMNTAGAIESLGALIRAGFMPGAATNAVGLPDIEHSGLVPVTVQGEDVAQGDA